MPTADDMLGVVLAYEVFAAVSKRGPLVTTVCRDHGLLTVGVLFITYRHLRRRIAVPL